MENNAGAVVIIEADVVSDENTTNIDKDAENTEDPLELNLSDMSVKEQIVEIEQFHTKMIKSLETLRLSVDYKIRLEASRTISGLLKNVQMSLMKQRELEIKEDIDFTSAKARRGMMMLIEVFFDSMMEAQVNDTSIETVKALLQVKLLGFEEKLTKELKGLSGELLDEVKNPFIK